MLLPILLLDWLRQRDWLRPGLRGWKYYTLAYMMMFIFQFAYMVVMATTINRHH